jgi:hypothetical protein
MNMKIVGALRMQAPRLFAALLLGSCILIPSMLSSQSTAFELPYNPDYDGNDYIGIADLLELLALYESEFSEESLHLNADSSAALLGLGELPYPKCAYACRSLPGSWKLASLEDLGMIWDQIPAETYLWLGGTAEREFGIEWYKTPNMLRFHGGGEAADYQWPPLSASCYCATVERRRVEYATCQGADIAACANAKTSQGWIPLGGIAVIPYYHHYSGYFPQVVQAFVRWVD